MVALLVESECGECSQPTRYVESELSVFVDPPYLACLRCIIIHSRSYGGLNSATTELLASQYGITVQQVAMVAECIRRWRGSGKEDHEIFTTRECLDCRIGWMVEHRATAQDVDVMGLAEEYQVTLVEVRNALRRALAPRH